MVILSYMTELLFPQRSRSWRNHCRYQFGLLIAEIVLSWMTAAPPHGPVMFVHRWAEGGLEAVTAALSPTPKGAPEQYVVPNEATNTETARVDDAANSEMAYGVNRPAPVKDGTVFTA